MKPLESLAVPSIRLRRKPLVHALKAVALGASLACAAPIAVYAENSSAQLQQFNIPAGELGGALEQFARRSGVNINYDSALLAGKKTAGVQGNYSQQEVLNILLEGTGLEAIHHEGGYSLKVMKTVGLDMMNTVTVYGRKRDDQVGNIPQSVSVLDQDVLSYGTANTVGHVLEAVPGAMREGSSLDMFADDYLIRGFSSEQSINGLSFRQTDHPTDLVNVERIEVLKGPSSVLYGQMEPGGTINVVTKQPLDHYQANASVELGSYNQKRTTLDVTGPINESVRARVNLALQDGESSVDFLDYKRMFIAPNVTIDLTDTTNLTIEGSYSQNEWTGVHGGAPLEGALLSNPNGQYDKSFNPAGPNSATERNSADLNIRLTEALTDNLDARFSYSYTHNKADWNEYVNFGLAADNRTLNRLVFVGKDTYTKDHEIIMDLTGEFDTGDWEHSFIVGVNYRDTKSARPNQIHLTSPIDLYDPQYTPMNLSAATLFRDRNLEQKDQILAAFLQDRIQVNDELQLLAGIRYTDAEQSQTAYDYVNNTQTVDGMSQTNWSSQFGVIYAVTDSTSVFVNRSESFVPQQGTTSGLQPLDAEESTQYEAGLRMEAGELALNIAGFRIQKENTAISDPLDDSFEVAQGSAESKGVEISLSGHVTPSWYLNAGYAYTDTEITSSDDADLEGNRFANVPLHSAYLQSRHGISAVPGLTLGGTVRYLGNRFGDDDNSFTLPSYVRLDLAAYYEINDQLQLDLLIDNALNEEIFAAGAFDGVVREPERTYMARLNYQF